MLHVWLAQITGRYKELMAKLKKAQQKNPKLITQKNASGKRTVD